MRRNKLLPPYKDQPCTNLKNKEEFARDLNDDSRIPALQLRSTPKHATGRTSIVNDQNMRLRSPEARSFDFLSHNSHSYEFKRKFGCVQARSSQRLPDGQPAVVFYEDKDTDSSSDEEFIAFEADRNSGAGTSVEWPFLIYKETRYGQAIRLCTSTSKQVIKPQKDCRRVFKTRMPELGCCEDCSHAHHHVQPGLQRYSQWLPSYRAKRYRGSNGPSGPEGYLTEKLQALSISPNYKHQPFTPQRNSLQHCQTQGVFQSCSHESRRPDHSKLQAKESIINPLQQPDTLTANQTADMLFTRKDVDPVVIIRTKGKIKDADQDTHTNTALTTKPTVQVIHTIQQVTDGDFMETMENSYEQHHLKEPKRRHSHSQRPTTTDTNSGTSKRIPRNRKRFSHQPADNQESPYTHLSNDSYHHIHDTRKKQTNGMYVCLAKTGKGIHNPSPVANQRTDRDSRPPPTQQSARRRNGTAVLPAMSKGRQSRFRTMLFSRQESREERCEATVLAGNQWRRRRTGVCQDTDVTHEHRRFTRVLAKRF